MGLTITVRLTKELSEWLTETARKTDEPVGRIVRRQLERAKREAGSQPCLRHAGQISGAPDLSTRRGYERR